MKLNRNSDINIKQKNNITMTLFILESINKVIVKGNTSKKRPYRKKQSPFSQKTEIERVIQQLKLLILLFPTTIIILIHTKREYQKHYLL